MVSKRLVNGQLERVRLGKKWVIKVPYLLRWKYQGTKDKIFQRSVCKDGGLLTWEFQSLVEMLFLYFDKEENTILTDKLLQIQLHFRW